MKAFVRFILLLISVAITQLAVASGSSFVPPPSGLPPCAVNPAPGNTACIATPICNPHGFCGTTSSTYGANYWSQLNSAFCGSIENNAFLSFTAESSTISFDAYVYNCYSDEAIQIMIFSAANCSSGPVVSHVCVNEMYAQNTPYNVTANGLTPGNQYYIMIDGFAGDVCDYTFVATDGVAIPLGLDVGNNVTLCTGESITVTAYGGDGTYTWDPSPNLSATSGATVTITPPTTPGTYTYTVHSQGGVAGCPTSNDYTLTITVQSCCAILSNNVSLHNCDAVNGVYSVDGTITINPPGSLVGDLVVKDCTGNLTLIPLGSTPYNYTLTGLSLASPTCNIEVYFSGSAECATAQTHILTYTAPSTATPTFNPISACEGAAAPTLPSVSNEGISGTWSPATINTSIVGSTPYTFTPSAGVCAPPAVLNVNIIAEPNVTVVSPAVFNCLDPTTNTFQLSGSSATPGSTLQWTDIYGGNTGFISGQTTTSPVVNTIGSYILTVTGPAPNSCVNSDTVVIVAGGYNPIVSIDPAIDLDCATPTTTLVGHVSNSSGNQTGLSFGWTTTNGNMTSSPNSETVDINSPGTYTLTATDIASTCVTSQVIQINGDLTLPVIDVQTPLGTVVTCTNPIIPIAANSDAGVSGTWTTAAPGNIINVLDSLGYNIANVNTAGTYTYSVTNPTNHCSATQVVTITVNNTLPIANAGPDMEICPSGTITIQGSGSTTSGGTLVYSWDGTDGNVTMYDFSNIPTPSVPTAATYILHVTDQSNGCSASDTMLAYNQIVPVIFADTTVCASSFNIPADSIQTIALGQWSMTPANSGTFSPSTSVLAPTFTPNNGVINVTLTYTNGCGSDNANLIFAPQPSVATPPAFSCNDMSEILTSNSYGPGIWTVQDNPSTAWLEDTALVFVTGPTTNGGSVNENVMVSVIPNAGQYNLTFTDNTCGYSQQITLNFVDYPWVEINDTTLCLGVQHTLTANAFNATDYSWNTGATTESIQVAQTGNYIVTVSNQCYTAIDTAVITFNACEIEAPNVISISSQAGNNFWHVKADGIADFNCIILNRWGTVVFEYNDATSGWDGKDKQGNLVTEGVYFYKINATREGGEKLVKQGFIHVVH